MSLITWYLIAIFIGKVAIIAYIGWNLKPAWDWAMDKWRK